MSVRVYSGQGEVTRVRFLGTDGFVAGTDTPLIRLFRTWEGRRRGPLLFENQVLLTDGVLAELIGYMHIVDVHSDKPEGFFFESYGFRAKVAEAADFTGRRLGEIPCPGYRSFVQDSYAMVKSSGAAVLSRIATTHLGYTGTYHRLVYPLTDDGRHVTHLAVAVCHPN